MLCGGQGGFGGFALFLALFQRRLGSVQRVLRGRHVQRLVGRHGRVLQRAAQGAGVAGLQGLAVRLQALDAALLLQQLALVGHHVALGGVALAQVGQGGRLPVELGRAGREGGLQLRLVLGVFAPGGGQRLALFGLGDRLLRGLPACTQLGQAGAAVLGQQLVQRRRGGLQGVAGGSFRLRGGVQLRRLRRQRAL